MYPETEQVGSSKTDDAPRSPANTDAYPFPIDAIVLAGTHQNPKRLIAGRNKAFLEVGGKLLIKYVVDALLAAERVGQVFVVGPAEELLEALAEYSSRVRVISQRGKMLTNCWAGIEASEDCHRFDTAMPVHERPLLVISCDLPLVTGRSIDDYISRCARLDNASEEPYAILAGVVDEPGVSPFHPEGNKPGIERPFVELDFGRLRLANIYVGRPRKLAHQKDWRNVIALTFNFLKSQGGWQAAWLSIRLQLTLMLSKGKGYWYRRLKKGNTRQRVEQSVSEVLGGPVKVVVSPYGGLSLDVDDEEDFKILDKSYEDWAAITANVDPERD